MVNSENARVTLAICRTVRSDTAQNIFYGTTIAYSVTALYNVLLISCRVVRRCIPKRSEVPFAKLTSVCVEAPQRGHEIVVE